MHLACFSRTPFAVAFGRASLGSGLVLSALARLLAFAHCVRSHGGRVLYARVLSGVRSHGFRLVAVALSRPLDIAGVAILRIALMGALSFA